MRGLHTTSSVFSSACLKNPELALWPWPLTLAKLLNYLRLPQGWLLAVMALGPTAPTASHHIGLSQSWSLHMSPVPATACILPEHEALLAIESAPSRGLNAPRTPSYTYALKYTKTTHM